VSRNRPSTTSPRGVGLKVLTGQGAAIDTTTPAGKLVCEIFAALAEFERELISERGVGYTRVSSLDQDPDRQLDGVVLDRTSPKGSWRKHRPPTAGSDAQLRPLATVT